MGRYSQHLASLEYEDFVKSVFETLLEKQPSGIEHNRRMLGKRSGHEHQIDIVIEAKIAGLDVLILVECKHYKRTVEIGDVLEFAERIDDVGGHKGVIVSTLGFQEGAIKVARGHGIALISTLPVWRHVLYNRSGDQIYGMTIRELYLGGDSDGDLLVGTTVHCVSHAVNIHIKAADGWREIIEYLGSEMAADALERYRTSALRRQFSPVCPLCGGALRTPYAHQCRHCGSDWHDEADPNA